MRGEYYRLGGECVKCPDNEWMLPVMMFIAIIFICIVSYVLNRKKFHIAFISIGVDYF